MKYIIILFFFLFPGFAKAQQTQKEYMNFVAGKVISDLKESWVLGIDSNSETVDMKVYNRFKKLFDTSAVIVDDINTFFEWGSYNSPGVYKTDIVPKPFDVYAHDITLQVKSISIQSIATVDSNLADPRAITYTIQRKAIIQKTGEFVLREAGEVAQKMISRRKDIDFVRSKDALAMRENLERKINDAKGIVYRFSSDAELLVTLFYDAQDSTCKINSITNISKEYKVVCLNDEDLDGVLDHEDRLQGASGDFTSSGMPDYDYDGVPDITGKSNTGLTNIVIDKCKKTYGVSGNLGCPASYFSSKIQAEGFIGFQANITGINLPELNELGYVDGTGNDAMDVLQSRKGGVEKPGLITGISAGGNLVFYLGKKRKQGISIGLTFSRFIANYTLTEPIVYTYKASDGTDFYRRQLTISRLKEGITYYVLNFPVLYNYRVHLGKRNMSSACFKIGPSFMAFKNTSDYDAVINVGGIYQLDPGQNEIVYDDYLDPASPYNVYVTSKGINEQNTDPGAIDIFSQLPKSYDFTDDKDYRGKIKNLTRFAVALNVGVDLNRKITEGLALKGGVHFVYAAIPAKNKKYKPFDRTTDDYNSIFNATAKSVYCTFGINAGLVYNF